MTSQRYEHFSILQDFIDENDLGYTNEKEGD
jgi:hypothetical protein